MEKRIQGLKIPKLFPCRLKPHGHLQGEIESMLIVKGVLGV